MGSERRRSNSHLWNLPSLSVYGFSQLEELVEVRSGDAIREIRDVTLTVGKDEGPFLRRGIDDGLEGPWLYGGAYAVMMVIDVLQPLLCTR